MGPINFRVDVHVEGPNPLAPDPIQTDAEWKSASTIFANVHEAYSYIQDLRTRWSIRSAIVIPTPNQANARFVDGKLLEFGREDAHG